MFAKAGGDPGSAASRGDGGGSGRGGGAGEKDSGGREGDAHGGADGVHGEREDDGRAREAHGAALCEQRTQSGSLLNAIGSLSFNANVHLLIVFLSCPGVSVDGAEGRAGAT